MLQILNFVRMSAPVRYKLQHCLSIQYIVVIIEYLVGGVSMQTCNCSNKIESYDYLYLSAIMPKLAPLIPTRHYSYLDWEG